MFTTKQSKKKIILYFIIILLLFSTNFFVNFYNITKFNYEQRLTKVYGFCSKESIGYLNYLKTKYKFDKNIKIVNYVHSPNVNWIIINPIKINEYSNELILLNYPGPEIKIQLNKNKLGEYNIDNFYFFLDKIRKDNYLEIKKIKTNNLSKPILKIFIKDSKGNIIKKIEVTKFKIYKDKIIYPVNIDFEDLKNSFKIYFRLAHIEIENDSEVFFILKNKYEINRDQILDNFEKCYYIKKND